MKYCSNCGSAVVKKIPEGDHLYRYVCNHCGIIHYQNPKIVAGCIPEWENKILLCQRAIEPRYGLWTLPAGFMENNETIAEAAARETREEASANIKIHSLFSLYDIPHISQVYVMFRAKLLALDFKPGQESLDVQLYSEDSIPWDKLAFPVIGKTLKSYFENSANGNFQMHMGTISSMKEGPSNSTTMD